MRGTDELREYTEKQVKWLDVSKVHYRKLLAIADRIDAEHEGICFDYQREHDDWAYIRDTCWVELPKDADGVPIHVGDVMEWVRHRDDDPTIVRKVSAVGVGTFLAWSDGLDRYAQYEAHAYRHYHAPTVEDVLCDLLNEYRENECTLEEARLSEYATRLRLAEGEDA